MNAILLMTLLGATALCLLGGLICLYRYLERKVLFPQLPRLWRGDRNRFFVFGALCCLCGAAFVAVSVLTATQAPPDEPTPKSPLDSFAAAAPETAADWRQETAAPAQVEPPAQAPEEPGQDLPQAEPRPEPQPTAQPEPQPMTPAQQTDFLLDQPPAPGSPADQDAAKRAEAMAIALSQPPQPTPEPAGPVAPAATPPTAAPSQPTSADPEPTPAPTTAPEPSPTAQPAATGAWTVCLASFPSAKEAKAHVERLAQQGVQAQVHEAQVKGRQWWRVCVGGHESLADSLKAAKELKAQGLSDTPFSVRAR
ncbi:Sporulation domain protein [Desulfarculus baarsii DSM 2075]|uniref:Sporulation domain protein n=1 Tax=Desulfarculus baarsii (strain ATCC 33931 / DSM 2075 / LMG 7858 / VKM B-1802 / 2st14) TaxID=644282 RepID=E1QKG8_DESB2|nr:SPOR domain-containing protein [Desulfarculus baarsii]ADK86061.1 Sporulation domain protein [Desulfarculus baarsii DSM 2075]